MTSVGLRAGNRKGGLPLVIAVCLALLPVGDGLGSHVVADGLLPSTGGEISIASQQLQRRGLTARFELGDQTGPGYVPMRISVASLGPVPADQRLNFRVSTRLGEEYPPQTGLAIDLPVTIEQGTVAVDFTRYLPKWSLGQFLDVTVMAEGEVLQDSVTQVRSGLPPTPVQVPQYSYAAARLWDLDAAGLQREARQDWLVVADLAAGDAPSLGALEDPFRDVDPSLLVHEDQELRQLVSDSKRVVQVADLARLPSDWRGYQGHDLVVLDGQASVWLDDHPTVQNALRDWVLLGGTVVVYGSVSLADELARWRFLGTSDSDSEARVNRVVSQQSALLERLQSRIRSRVPALPPARADPIRPSSDPQPASATAVANQLSAANLAADAGLRSVLRITESILEQRRASPLSSVAIQSVGAGQLVSIEQADAGDSRAVPPTSTWQLISALTRDRLSPMLRLGADPLRGHPRFRRWTVPGVLQPPVYTFVGLLTLFVILVGPVAYRLTSKHGRLHLMFAIAPVMALLTTLAMFGYGIIADGFGTKARIRQLTWIDGGSGDAGERVLSTYFAGIRPAAGLRFDGTAMVMRQAEPDGMLWHELGGLPPQQLGRVRVQADQQIFAAAFLPSRDQRQFVVHRPRANLGALQCTPPDQDSGDPDLINALTVDLHEVILRDRAGRYWRVEGLAAGQVQRGEHLTADQASRRLSSLYNQYRPLAAAGSETRGPSRNESDFDPLKSIAVQADLNPYYQDGLFEYWLQRHLQLSGELPEGHFVATADVSDDVIAVRGAEVLDSVRYLFGTFQ